MASNECSGVGWKVKLDLNKNIRVELDNPEIKVYQAHQLSDALIRASQAAEAIKKNAT